MEEILLKDRKHHLEVYDWDLFFFTPTPACVFFLESLPFPQVKGMPDVPSAFVQPPEAPAAPFQVVDSSFHPLAMWNTMKHEAKQSKSPRGEV